MRIQPPKVFVTQSPGKGFGVFAAKNFVEGEVIERCYCIEVTKPVKGNLINYAFNYPPGTNETKQVLPLGYGCIYNHSENNNAFWIKTPDHEMHFDFVAKRDIKIGEEICTYYGKNYFKYRKI